MSRKLKILVAGRSEGAIETLEEVLQTTNADTSTRHISNGHSNPLYGLEDSPDVLVFHLSSQSEEELNSLLENPAEQRPTTIVVGPANSTQCMRMSMQAGVRDYIEEPLDSQELLKTIERIRVELSSTPTQAKLGTVTSVVATKGGCGASFLAANMAHTLAARDQLRVALLELDLQFGSLSQYLDVKPRHGLINALDMAEQLDAIALEAFMARHDSGLRLMSPMDEDIILSKDVDPQRFARILSLMTSGYDRVIVDLPRQIDELSAEVYEASDHILLVTQQEFASVRDATRLRHLILTELDVPAERITVIVNRYNKKAAVELGDIANTTGVDKKDFILIPNSYQDVAESVNIGVPIFDHARGSNITKAIIAANEKLNGMQTTSQRGVVGRMLSNLMGGQ